jgi:hypothetical protein
MRSGEETPEDAVVVGCWVDDGCVHCVVLEKGIQNTEEQEDEGNVISRHPPCFPTQVEAGCNGRTGIAYESLQAGQLAGLQTSIAAVCRVTPEPAALKYLDSHQHASALPQHQ